jgi:hypothetical protein
VGQGTTHQRESSQHKTRPSLERAWEKVKLQPKLKSMPDVGTKTKLFPHFFSNQMEWGGQTKSD